MNRNKIFIPVEVNDSHVNEYSKFAIDTDGDLKRGIVKRSNIGTGFIIDIGFQSWFITHVLEERFFPSDEDVESEYNNKSKEMRELSFVPKDYFVAGAKSVLKMIIS